MNTDPSKGRRGATRDDLPRRQGLKLLLPKEALDVVRKEVSAGQHQHQETGGIIIGDRANINRLFVADLTGPGPNAHHHQTEFSPDIDHAQRCLDAYREDWDVYWLGVWHKHPGQMRTLSQGDVKQMRNLVQDPDTLDEIVSIIATLQNDTIRLNGYHMDESLEPYRLPMSIVDDDIPLRKQFLREHDPEPPRQDKITDNSDIGSAQKDDRAEIGNNTLTEEDGQEDFGDEAGEDLTKIHRPTNSDTGLEPEAPSDNSLDIAAATQSAILNAGLPAAGDENRSDAEPPMYDPERDDIVISIDQKAPEKPEQIDSLNQSEENFPTKSGDDEERDKNEGYNIRSLLSFLNLSRR